MTHTTLSTKEKIYSTHHHLIEYFISVGCGIAMGLLILGMPTPNYILVIIATILITWLTIAKIEWGLFFLVFITHSNFSTVLIEHHNAPSVAKFLIALLFLGIIIRWLLWSERPSGWGKLTLLIVAYGLIGISSMLFEDYTDYTAEALGRYSKDAIIAVIVIMLLNSSSLLRGIIWSFLASGIFLSAIAIFQHLTETQDNNYWGFALAPIEHLLDESKNFRVSGTLGDPNYFCQFLLILVPLAFDRLKQETHFLIRTLAFLALGIILFTIMLTYSRGGIVGLIAMLIVFLLLYPRYILIVSLTIFFSIPVLKVVTPDNYISRMTSLEYLMPDKANHPIAEDSFQGRKSEMLVAMKMFLDHPFTGVGFGAYDQHYQKYSQSVFLDFRHEEREAHNRYLEILSETGIIGFMIYLLLLYLMFSGLLHARKTAIRMKRQDMEGIITAFLLSLVSLQITYIFLHDSWPRLSWLLVGIAFAIPNIVQKK